MTGPEYLIKEIKVYLYLNNIDKYLDIIQFSASIPSGISALELLLPTFDSIKSHPRFIEIFEKLNPNNN